MSLFLPVSRFSFLFVLSLSVLGFSPTANATPPCEAAACPSNWVGMSVSQKREVEQFAKGYKRFINLSRTEATTVTETVRLAKQAGFQPWQVGASVHAGAKYYDINRDRSLTLFIIGSDALQSGAHISASHIDSPRLELKARPLQKKSGFVLFQTNYHGGIKNYQWTNIPLALLGHVDRKNGQRVHISVGLKPDDPIFIIPGLSPHVDVDLRKRTNRDVIAAEELDPIAGHREKNADEGAKALVVSYLRDTYGIGLDDLVSAELSLVPAFAPRDVGFDRSLIAAYGQDDRLSAYASIRAILEAKTPKRTAFVWLADNEEVGNRNNTGAHSTYFMDLFADVLFAQMGDSYREPHLKRALKASRVVSTDVNPGINPIWPSAWEGSNAPRQSHGVNLKIYGKGNDANSEYIAWTRAMLDEANIPWQTATYKVGKGGGGTLGGELSHYNMDVIDFGVPVLSIHTPYAISSKSDLYWLYKANAAFIKKK
ncbi:Probable M18-family aminopeptidase 1 [hydrothermal vent metagenome]|uniref:Probable M18-family aminopeptidase 1 n=1 Tax=hydrothermal vent metagenome TaxID=652676 RepID=A0A3B0S6Y4_9ZZZZ